MRLIFVYYDFYKGNYKFGKLYIKNIDSKIYMSATEKSPLVSELNNNISKKVNDFFNTIKVIIDNYSKSGYSSLIIFMPFNQNSTTIDTYHFKFEGSSTGMGDDHYKEQLIKKFKSEGIKLTIEKAVSKIDFNYQYNTYYFGGYLLEIKWDKDYRTECCGCCCVI